MSHYEIGVDWAVNDPTKVSEYTGITIMSDPHVMVRKQTKFPRSKRRRIRKKWSKREKNYSLVPGMVYILGQWIAHPDIYQKITKVI